MEALLRDVTGLRPLPVALDALYSRGTLLCGQEKVLTPENPLGRERAPGKSVRKQHGGWRGAAGPGTHWQVADLGLISGTPDGSSDTTRSAA